jgi:hypothetical protein
MWWNAEMAEGTSTSVSSLVGWLVGWFQQHLLLSILSAERSIYSSAIYPVPCSALYWSTYSAWLQLNSLWWSLWQRLRWAQPPSQAQSEASCSVDLSRICSVECCVDCWALNTLFSAEQWVLCRMLSHECCQRPEWAGFYPPLLLSCLLCDWLAGRAHYSSEVNA